jgi:hypothetical protein
MTCRRASSIVFVFTVALGVAVGSSGCAGRRPSYPTIVGVPASTMAARSRQPKEPGAAVRDAARALQQRAGEGTRKGSGVPADVPVSVIGNPSSPQQPAGTAGSYSVLETQRPVEPPAVPPSQPPHHSLKLALQKVADAVETRSFLVLVLLILCAAAAAMFVRSRRVP